MDNRPSTTISLRSRSGLRICRQDASRAWSRSPRSMQLPRRSLRGACPSSVFCRVSWCGSSARVAGTRTDRGAGRHGHVCLAAVRGRLYPRLSGADRRSRNPWTAAPIAPQPADRFGRQSQLRQDRAIQCADRQPPKGRQLRGRDRRAQGRLAADALGPARAHTRSARRLQPRSLTPDEQVTADVLLGRRAGEAQPDFVVCVTDATNLRQNLRLVLSLKRLGLPMVVALNMSDIARRKGIAIDAARLAAELGVPVVETSASKPIRGSRARRGARPRFGPRRTRRRVSCGKRRRRPISHAIRPRCAACWLRSAATDSMV
jgi:hypothetical protein